MFIKFFLASLSLVTTCLANDCFIDYQDSQLDKIIANATLRVVDEKIYLDLDKIFLTQEGIFLEISSQEFIPLSHLGSDSSGCYLDARVTKPCPYCGRPRISYALKCRNPECPSNQPKDKSG